MHTSRFDQLGLLKFIIDFPWRGRGLGCQRFGLFYNQWRYSRYTFGKEFLQRRQRVFIWEEFNERLMVKSRECVVNTGIQDRGTCIFLFHLVHTVSEVTKKQNMNWPCPNGFEQSKDGDRLGTAEVGWRHLDGIGSHGSRAQEALVWNWKINSSEFSLSSTLLCRFQVFWILLVLFFVKLQIHHDWRHEDKRELLARLILFSLSRPKKWFGCFFSVPPTSSLGDRALSLITLLYLSFAGS